MEDITDALKQNASYKTIKDIYGKWEEDSKALLLADLAIVHKHFEALRFIVDEEGVDIFYTPYDTSDRITPFYIAELLCTLNKEYEAVKDYIHDAANKWGRKANYLWVNKLTREKKVNTLLSKIPQSVARYICEEFL
jgi:hypothetical protein